jgi:CheY-like chemotaxis protein
MLKPLNHDAERRSSQARSHSVDAPEAIRRGNMPGVRVLIIDDDASALECFEQMLIDDGHDVRAVRTVEAGLAEAAIGAPDVILLDFHMPVMDGLECLRHLRREPLNLDVPVALLTGDYFLDDDVIQELQALGARIYFKPVWDTDLHQILEALVSQSRRGNEQ